MSRLLARIRWWFFDTFGVRDSKQLYAGHGYFIEINGWTFLGRFHACYPGAHESEGET